MEAIIVEGPGAAPVCGDFPEPVPQQGEQVYDLVAAGVHWVTKSTAAGQHYAAHDQFPRVAGLECTARAADGSLVYTGFVREPWGTMAQRLASRAGFPLPAGVDPLAIAAGMNPGMSGYLPLTQRRDEIGSLGTVLVLGATGMAGRMAVEAALALGAERVVAAGRDPQQLAALARPRVTTASLAEPDPVAALVTSLGGVAPSLVLDYVWGPVAQAAFAALDRSGADEDADIVYAEIGGLAGPTAELPASLLRSRRIRIVGSGLGSAPRDQIMAAILRVAALIADGTLTAPYTAYPMDQVATAWSHTGPTRAVITP